jgi:hypothetical protein
LNVTIVPSFCRVQPSTILAATALLSAWGTSAARGQQLEQSPTPAGSTVGPSGAETAPENTFAAGLDVYSGISNYEGVRRFSDGFWMAGAGLAYPSVAYLKMERRDGSSARLTMGAGDMYRGSSRTVNQPVEAWFQKPVGKLSVTAGKFWVPFALQEWQYESKYGVQLQRKLGQTDFIGSVNYDRVSQCPNLYFRAGHNFREGVSAGVSLAAGEGLSYGSLHNKAIALDASLQNGNLQFFSEFSVLQRRASDRFTFFHLKLIYDRDARLKPFAAFYKWNDRGDAFGDFRSLAAGATYTIRPELLVEGGLAATRDKNIFWIQLHLTLERNLRRSQPPFVPRPVAAP